MGQDKPVRRRLVPPPGKDAQTARLNVTPVIWAPENADEERAQFPGFARHAEPWHGQILQELYTVFWQLNAALFQSQLKSPHLMIGTTAPRVLGFCKNITDYGARMQITLRPSLFDGSHSAVGGSWYESVGVKRFVNDILLHEMVHQFHFEVTRQTEESQRGHGRYFATECNRIARDHFVDEEDWHDNGSSNVLAGDNRFGPRIQEDPTLKRHWLVYTRRRGAKDAGKHLAKYWPHNIRPEGFYGPKVTWTERRAPKKPKHVPMWARMFENIIYYHEAGRMHELILELKKELKKVQDADCQGCVNSWAESWNEPICQLDALKPRGLPEDWLEELPKCLRPHPEGGDPM